MKSHASEQSDDLDDGWDEPDSASFTAAPTSARPGAELDELDDGWGSEGDEAPAVRAPGSAPATRGRAAKSSLSKKERRDLERRLRAEAAAKKTRRKTEQKERRREEARRSAEARSAERRAETERSRATTRSAAPKKAKTPPRRVAPVEVTPARGEAPAPVLTPAPAKKTRSKVSLVVAAVLIAGALLFVWLSRA